MAIIAITLSQRADIHQIIGFQNDERWAKNALFIDNNIQQVQIGSTPKQGNLVGKLIVYTRNSITNLIDLVVFFGDFDVQISLIRVKKTYSNAAYFINFRPFHRIFSRSKNVFSWSLICFIP